MRTLLGQHVGTAWRFRTGLAGAMVAVIMLCSGCLRSEASMYEAHLAVVIPQKRAFTGAPLPPPSLASADTSDR